MIAFNPGLIADRETNVPAGRAPDHAARMATLERHYEAFWGWERVQERRTTGEWTAGRFRPGDGRKGM